VRPAARRTTVGLLQETFGVPERRACRVVGICRSSMRYWTESVAPGTARVVRPGSSPRPQSALLPR
jgi:hypothetical protein